MDRRNSNSTSKGRGRGSKQCWRSIATTKDHSHNFACRATANLPRETPSSSKDDVSQPKPFVENSNQFGNVNAPKSLYWKIGNSPTPSGGKGMDLVNDVSRVKGAVNPNSTDFYFFSLSYTSSNLMDKKHEMCGSSKSHMVDNGEKSGNSLRFGTSSPGTSSQRHNLAAGSNSFSQIASSNKDDVFSYQNPPSETRLRGNNLKRFNYMNTFKDQCNSFHNSYGQKNIFPGVKNVSLADDDAKGDGHLCFDPSLNVGNMTFPFSNANIENTPTKDEIQSEQTSQKEIESESSDYLNCQSSGVPFDICPPLSKSVNALKPSLLEVNKSKRAEAKRIIEGQKIIELRSGMVLLKKYISYDDQVKIVKEIRDLGVGVGGFYKPGYRDGGKLHLKMMCLGKNWDCQKKEYGDKRQIDDSKPPSLPTFFHKLVKGAIEASHSFLREHSKSPDVKRVLPLMSPNICIVNFYKKSGRLGLHQDKNESKESLHRQLPVVSFSIGDSAVFLYGDERDSQKADKVVLESGDVLIFGGKSRLVYHGVSSIKSDTAPKALQEETRLRPGRLNLTFREF